MKNKEERVRNMRAYDTVGVADFMVIGCLRGKFTVLLRRGKQERYYMKRLRSSELVILGGVMGECTVRLLSVLKVGEILSCEQGTILVKHASCLRSIGA